MIRQHGDRMVRRTDRGGLRSLPCAICHLWVKVRYWDETLHRGVCGPCAGITDPDHSPMALS
jgi:hypothetical protein